MQPDPTIFTHVAAAGPLWPLAAFFLLGLRTLFVDTPSERFTTRLALTATSLSAVSACAAVVARLLGHTTVEAGPYEWFRVGSYAFELGFTFDALSVTMLFVGTVVSLLVGVFSVNYLHRDSGFHRFFLHLLLFVTGVQLLVGAATIDLLFVGWELVGLSSMLLVAFFRDRRGPVRGALRVYTTYRVTDVGLLVGAMLLHHAAGSALFAEAFGPHATPLSHAWAEVLGIAFLFAAAGKSAQFPFGGWLTRAMEGPTPSSALFYGAVSIHLGAYLLLRLDPLYAQAPIARALIVLLGLATAAYGVFVGRVQGDVKSALAFATMTQVGLVFAEIGLGLHEVAILHLVGNACLRCVQFLRAPAALRDEQEVRAAHEGVSPGVRPWRDRIVPAALRVRIFELALERLHLDAIQDRMLQGPLLALGARLDAMERRWVSIIATLGTGREDSGRRVVDSSEVTR